MSSKNEPASVVVSNGKTKLRDLIYLTLNQYVRALLDPARPAFVACGTYTFMHGAKRGQTLTLCALTEDGARSAARGDAQLAESLIEKLKADAQRPTAGRALNNYVDKHFKEWMSLTQPPKAA